MFELPSVLLVEKTRINIGVSEPCTQGPPSSETQYLSSKLGPQAPYKWTVKIVQSLIDWLIDVWLCSHKDLDKKKGAGTYTYVVLTYLEEPNHVYTCWHPIFKVLLHILQ